MRLQALGAEQKRGWPHEPREKRNGLWVERAYIYIYIYIYFFFFFFVKGKWENWLCVLDLACPFCRNSVVPSENIKAVFQGTLAPAWHRSPVLAPPGPVAGRTEPGPLQPRPLPFSAREPSTEATREAGLAAEGPRCQALDWASAGLEAGPFPRVCPGFAAACVPVCSAGLGIRLLLAPASVRSLFPF